MFDDPIDLAGYMEKNRKEKVNKAYDQVLDALNGLPLDFVLNILATATRGALLKMPEVERTKNAMIFYKVIRFSEINDNDPPKPLGAA